MDLLDNLLKHEDCWNSQRCQTRKGMTNSATHKSHTIWWKNDEWLHFRKITSLWEVLDWYMTYAERTYEWTKSCFEGWSTIYTIWLNYLFLFFFRSWCSWTWKDTKSNIINICVPHCCLCLHRLASSILANCIETFLSEAARLTILRKQTAVAKMQQNEWEVMIV